MIQYMVTNEWKKVYKIIIKQKQHVKHGNVYIAHIQTVQGTIIS
jgi:hypothetical protein